MKKFYVVDHLECSYTIWQSIINKSMLRLKSKPKNWCHKNNDLPEGNWKLICFTDVLTAEQYYEEAGIPKPEYRHLPAVFCVDGDVMCKRFNVTAMGVIKFIKENL